MGVQAEDIVLARPGGQPIGVVVEVIGERAYLRLDDTGSEHEVRTRGCHALGPGRCWVAEPGALAARLQAAARPWAPAQIESTTERIYGWADATALDLVPRLEAAALALGFTVVGAANATQLACVGHPEAPKVVLVVENLEPVSRLRAYDGDRARLAWLAPEHEALAHALLDALPGALAPGAADDALRAAEASARNRALADRDRELTERHARRETKRVAAQQREEEALAARRLAARAALMNVQPDVDVDGFPLLSLPGRKLPKKRLLAALQAKALRTPNLRGARISASKGDARTWEVSIDGAGEALLLGFHRHDDEDDVFTVDVSWPGIPLPRSSWRDVASFPVEEVGPWFDAIAQVYAELSPGAVGLAS